jgi:hypothetical protein
MKKVFFAIGALLLFSCTSSTKDRHVFHFVITGNSTTASDLYGKMGPGIEFDSPTIDIPFEVSHEVYGQKLDYALRISDSDTSHKYDIKVYIDDQLVKESTSYDPDSKPPRISISGTFQ